MRKLHNEHRLFEHWLDEDSGDAVLAALRRYRQLPQGSSNWNRDDDDDAGGLQRSPEERLSMLTNEPLSHFEGLRDEMEGHLALTHQLLRLCRTTFVPPYRRSGAAVSSEDAERRRAVLLDYDKLRVTLADVTARCTEELLKPLCDLLEKCGARNVLSFLAAAAPRSRDEEKEEDSDRLLDTQQEQEVYQFVEMRSVDEELEAEKRREMAYIAQQMLEVRALQEESQRLVQQHGEQIDLAATDTDRSLRHAVQSRLELSAAARYKVAGATLTGAVVGGLVGGPVGLVAGAKSAATIALATVAGAATGGVVVKAVVSASTARAGAVDDNYDDRAYTK